MIMAAPAGTLISYNLIEFAQLMSLTSFWSAVFFVKLKVRHEWRQVTPLRAHTHTHTHTHTHPPSDAEADNEIKLTPSQTDSFSLVTSLESLWFLPHRQLSPAWIWLRSAWYQCLAVLSWSCVQKQIWQRSASRTEGNYLYSAASMSTLGWVEGRDSDAAQ